MGWGVDKRKDAPRRFRMTVTLDGWTFFRALIAESDELEELRRAMAAVGTRDLVQPETVVELLIWSHRSLEGHGLGLEPVSHFMRRGSAPLVAFDGGPPRRRREDRREDPISVVLPSYSRREKSDAANRSGITDFLRRRGPTATAKPRVVPHLYRTPEWTARDNS